MKKPTIFKTLIAVVFLLLSFSSHAQLRKGFTTRYTTSLNGDILVIGNNSLNRDTGKNGGRPLDNYDDQGSTSKVNDNFDMKYIDVDSETSFNSSYATLKIPDASKSCFEIVYAALYWSGTYQGTDRSKINQVRLKTPTATTYKDLTGSVLWDEGGTGVATPYGSLPYACFVDITDDVKAAKEGIYTVADVMCSEGKFSPGGNSAGWSIFVIYKDPLLPSKYITSFDGFSIIRSSDPPLDIPISGFRTNPFGNVNVKLAFSALEGDNQLEGDGLQIIGGKPSSVWGAISSLARPITPAIPAGGPIWNPTPAVPAKPNFFNSTITDGDVIMGGRKPSSKNTLGFDAGVVTLDNNVGGVQNSVMQNDETSATLRINTSQDSYFMFFNAMSVEIIAPKIVLKKNVLSDKDVNIGSQPVTLNQELRYEIKFKNEGNDDAKNFTITDVIPDNVIFNGVSDILVMDPRITATYTAATRTLVFSIPDALVIAKGAEFTLKFKVKVVDDCNELIDACSNEIKNTAVSKYYGVKNTTPEGFGEGSYSTISSCNVGEPTSTNFLVGIKDCLFSRNVSLCGTVVLTAANGYSTYVWRDPNGVIFGGNNRQVTIDKPGTYTVNNSGAANCEDIQQTFIVTDYLASANKNPIKGDNIDPATGVAYGCVRDNKPFPKIFLCGLNDKRFIDTQITGATSITWQETKDVTPSTNPDSCPYEGATNWTTVANGPTFTADRAGVFRLVVNYGNNTCVVTHYFNVYQNLLDATAKKQDIVCNTKGSITVTNPLPNTGYVYSLDGTNYQASNIFNNVAKGSYTVSIKQTVLEVGQVFPCIFKVDVNVEQLDFTTKLDATHPLCNGEHGTITATINNVPGQYQFILRKKGSTVEIQNSGLINNNIITFNGVDPGVYEVLMSTANNGCSVIKEIEVFDYRLTAVANITKALTACSNGEITVSVTGGTPRPGPPPYYLYYVNGNTNFVTDPKIPVTASGDYNIVVVDANGCTVKIPTIKVTDLPKPKVTFKADDVNCYGGNSGVINVDITPADSGYAVSYSVNGGAFSSVAPITNLTPDTYSIVVKYTYNGVECLDPAVNVTIKGPDAALSASAGVSELAGCGPTGSEFQGKVRITNPQGGTPGYTYSFDDQKTWSPINEAFVDPGTYTLYIKDSKGCIFAMSGVVLDGKPADPTIALDPTVYNCDGTGKTTATVTNSGGKNYSYEYYIDGKPNTPLTNNIFNNVLTGPHTISVKYKLLDAATYSNLLHEDFGKDTFTYTDTASPDGSSPGINPAFCWERQIEATKCNGNRLFANGEYTVTSSLRNDPYSGWQNPIDHTSGSRTGGRYLAVDAGTAIPNNAVLYRKTIKDIIPGQPIQVRFFATNLLKIGNTQPDASLTVELQNAAGTPLSSQSTGKIPKTNGWVEYNRSIDPGSNTTLDFVLRLEISQVNGIDFAVDDIEVYQLPKSCITEKKFDFNIDSNKAFTVLEPAIESVDCSGGNTGKITITAQNFNGSFLYSIDGGSNWTTSTTSPVIIDKLVAKSYSVIVKSDAAGTCSKSFTKVITENQPVTVTASVTTLPTCTSGATITAEAKGGVGPYTYALKLADGVTDVAGYGFPHSATFAGVSNGTYTVVAHDSKGCTSAVSTVVIVDKPAPPVASLDATSDLCYDTTNKATLVVTATGTGILNYSLDGGAFDTNNTFTNVGVGTHNIVVRDGNNCTTPINGIIINGELTAKGNVTKTLDCNTVGATIKVDINGGKAPFTYKYKLGVGGTYSASVNVTGNTFNYAAPGTGTYYFEITDSNTPKACVTTTSVTVDAITKPIASAAPTNVTCFGGSTGEVTLGASGGSGSGYSYSFNGSGFTSTIKYTSLKAGIPYKYQVKDDKGCISDEGSITLTEPGAVTGSIKATDIQCGTTGTVAAIVTLTAGGGTAPYKYSFTGPSNYGDGNTYSTTVSGVVKGYIIDKNGCQLGPLSITIDALDQITDITITDNGYDCSTTPPGGHVNIAAVKGGVSAPIRYQIISGPAGYNSAVNSDGEFKSLTPGDYIFQATDIKTGCTFQKPYTVKGAPDIVAGGSVLTAIKCFGGTGTIQFTVNGVKGKYDYVITDSALNSIQNGNNIAGTTTTITVSSALTAGDYTITATDRTTKCQAIYVVKLTQPTIGVSVTATASNITCSKFTSTITAVGLGGTPAYKYAVVKQTALDPAVTDYDPSATLSVNTNNGLDVNWVVFVMDANGCTAKYPVKIDKDPTPTVTAKVDNQCGGSGNSFTITATATTLGTGTLTYGINGVNGAFSTNNVFNVGPGTYTVWVKDGNLCPASAPAVTVYDQLTAGTVIKELDCSLTPNATITVTPSGGLAPYKYEVSTNGGTSYSAMASNVYSTAVAGTFKIKVTDANLCTVIVTETILSISNPTASIVTQSNV
ncbi:DUF11 domain-containing protein, partial [Flavobacterium sp. ov086]|uniref:DUF11 domain-containing protein n=1 Tax=Flavobacterium sp. ov086 TaxID=1761785 RepID=UPI000B7383A8